MSFKMVVAICTEALLFILVGAYMVKQFGNELTEKRAADPNYKNTIGDWCTFAIVLTWIGFQFWKAWSVIQTLL